MHLNIPDKGKEWPLREESGCINGKHTTIPRGCNKRPRKRTRSHTESDSNSYYYFMLTSSQCKSNNTSHHSNEVNNSLQLSHPLAAKRDWREALNSGIKDEKATTQDTSSKLTSNRMSPTRTLFNLSTESVELDSSFYDNDCLNEKS